MSFSTVPDDVSLEIASYVSDVAGLISISECNRQLRQTLFSSKAKSAWNVCHRIFSVCIDDYCPLCPMKKGDKLCVPSILAKVPLSRVTIHLFVTQIPEVLKAIERNTSIDHLELRLSNKSDSPSLAQLLSSFYLVNRSTAFITLKRLVLDSTHLQHVNLEGRSILLSLLGERLESLSFLGVSPGGIFTILAKRCPKLVQLRVDRAQSQEDLALYVNEYLVELCLHRANFIPHENLSRNFPRLKKLRFSSVSHLDAMQMESAIRALPSTLEELRLETPGTCVNEAIFAISRRLRSLHALCLQGAHETGCISRAALLKLGREVTSLQALSITTLKSISGITFAEDAFDVLGSAFPSLRTLTIMCERSSIAQLRSVLSESGSLREVQLWERRPCRWTHSGRRWDVITKAVDVLSHEFPHIHISLHEQV